MIDLSARAGLDKVLALSGGPAMVALWAQLQSVVELVSAVTLAGVLQGLTVLIAQLNRASDERTLLRDALKLGFCTSLAVALLVALAAPELAVWLTPKKIQTDLFLLAALAGCMAIIPATLNAYWLGKHRQQRMLVLAFLNSIVFLLVAASTWLGFSLRGLMWVQCAVMVIIGLISWRYLYSLWRGYDKQKTGTPYFRKLLKFVPAGLAIGIMSPVSILLIRGILSDPLSWSEVGVLQALWRSTEWVTAVAAGVLALIFLPRFSAAFFDSDGSVKFRKEVMRAGAMVLFPAACLLLLLFFNQRFILATLYNAQFTVSDETAALFMLGAWIRIASWVFLFGLFAAHRTGMIITGEILSLPFYALLLKIFSEGMTVERSALLYLTSYLIYFGFNAIALIYATRKTHLPMKQ